MKTTAPILAVLALLCVPALAQDKKAPTASVQVQPVKAVGKRKKDAKPAIPPKLEGIKATLAKTPYDRFLADGMPRQTVKAAAKTDMAFPDLPKGYALAVSWTDGKDGGLELAVTLTREKEKGKPPAKVADMKVQVKDGGSYLIKCPGAYADGDLLLVITAKRL